MKWSADKWGYWIEVPNNSNEGFEAWRKITKNKNKFGIFKKEGHNCFLKINNEGVLSDN